MREETSPDNTEKEIADLESRLQNARRRLTESAIPTAAASTPAASSSTPSNADSSISSTNSLHSLLLLSDSALPLGSFAYSSGLESFLAHNKPHPRSPTSLASFDRFLKLSIASIASTTLPYVLAAHRQPETLETLDNDLDASTPCVVSQRASLAQGRALLGVWERSFRWTYATSACVGDDFRRAIQAIGSFLDSLKSSVVVDDSNGLGPKGHLPPLWGTVCLAMGMDLRQTAYVFMLNHAKAVLSAAVRASVMGPYQAQNVLASRNLQDMIVERIEREWQTEVENAGQVVPMIDLWVGRHELLYSRIFNS